MQEKNSKSKALGKILNQLDKLESLISSSIHKKEILTAEEAKDHLGISLSTLYKLVSSKKLEYLKVNNKLLRFHRSSLDKFLTQTPVKARLRELDTNLVFNKADEILKELK